LSIILSTASIKKFQQKILDHYRKHGRQMPWRETDNPYHIFISEIMLQQTQVSRVEEKYTQFIAAFPDVAAIEKAPLSRILAVWQGLGYNRRALSIKKAANVICGEYNGWIPQSKEALLSLPGIGEATASSIMAFAFDLPVVFIETNIRTVFIHFFFQGKNLVSDEEILPLVEKCLYKRSPRIWYWALMDYGSMLKKKGEDKNKKSRHYVKQSKFEGSRRQLRGAVLKYLISNGYMSLYSLEKSTGKHLDLIKDVVEELDRESFIVKTKRGYRLRDHMD
jgi:A/G-specific adenine glycosylase